jgi:hypothetical protein
VEYLLPLPPPPGPLLVRGVLDCLWRGEEGAWHLLLYDTTGDGQAGQAWQTRLAFGALAVREQFGKTPRTARCYRCAEGRLASIAGGPRRAGQLLTELARALAREPFSIGLDGRPS